MNFIIALAIIFLSLSPLVKFIHILLGILFITIYYIFKGIKVEKKSVLRLITFLLFLILHYFFKEILNFNYNLKILILNTETILKFILSFYLGQLIKNKDTFFRELEKIIFILSVISLAFFTIQLLTSELLYKLPSIKIGRIQSVYIQNFILNKEGIFLKRNSGIAWEPGAFQLLVNIGLFLNLKREEKLLSYKNLIYTITILTTVSTVGILVLIIQILSFIKNLINKKTIFRGIFAILVFGIVIYIDFNLEKGLINQHIIKKINLKNKNESTLERKYHFEMDIESFKKNIFLGRGIINYQRDRDNQISSNSYTRILATYGTIFFSIYIVNLIIGIRNSIQKNWNIFLVIVLFTFTNEIIWASPLILILLFMEKKNENKIM